MAYYLVRAKPNDDLTALQAQLQSEDILGMRPFGGSLHESLVNARIAEDGYAIWEEEDYCTPPLAMERRAVIDNYFTELTVERVNKSEGWSRIEHLPFLWETSPVDHES